MPIRIPDSLPATEVLEGENIFVMTEYRAMHQDIRPLKVLLLNLMPTKIVTETQIMRKLSNTPLQIEVSLLQTASHEAKNVSEQHLDTFYTTFDEIKDQRFDGMIITGAPVELLDFEDVDYWDELARIMDWSATNVHSTFHICWGAQAGIYHHYGIPKYELENKLFGVFDHEVVKPSSPLVRGFNDSFRAPHSRYTEVHAADIEAHPDLELIAVSDEAGVYMRRAPTAGISSCSATPSTTPTRSWPSTSAISRKAWTCRCLATTSRTTIRRSPSRHLARARAAVVYELVELLCVPDHALRFGESRHRRGQRP